ncbi:MAG TPA: hypothetical protein VL995_18205 [Cellvibrio sp.]|nr:hypothetical protein [Cellvibrio sp.]
MLKKVSFLLLLSSLLAACGGDDDDDDKKPTSSSSVMSSSPAPSSMPASSVAPSSTPASSVAPSSTPASSSAAPSSEPVSSAQASSTMTISSAAASSTAAAFDGTFTTANSLTFWTVQPNWETSVGTAAANVDDQTLTIIPTWAATTDGFNIETTLENTIDVTGATISLDVYMPESYIVDGKLAMQIYFKDSTGKFANGGWIQTAWGPWRWSGNEVSNTNTAADNRYGWVTLNYQISGSGIKEASNPNPASWGYNPDGIDITKVKSFGIEITAKGGNQPQDQKPINITGNIKIDNVELPGM